MNADLLVEHVGEVVGVAFTVAATWALSRVRSRREAVSALHDEVRTNHGKRAGEYLEMVGELRDWSRTVDTKLDDLSANLQAHTLQDAENFGRLDRRLDRIERR